MIRLLVLDVEGVLTAAGGSQYPWPLADLVAARDLLAAAPAPTVLCTGRQVPYVEAVIQALALHRPLAAAGAGAPPLLGVPSIAENGACFLDPLAKRVFPHPALDEAAVARLRRLRDERLRPLAARTGAVLEAGKDYTASLNPPPAAPGARERLRPAEWLPEVRAALGAEGADFDLRASESAVDITPAGIGKAAGVRVLRSWLGLAAEEVAGVGDSAADAEWLAEVGWSAAPANGREALPGLAYYAAAPEARGLRQVVQHLAETGWDP